MSAIDYDLKRIRAVVFDVDGVLSPSIIPMSTEGEPLRMLNVKDGYVLQHAVRSGIRICIISGGVSRAVEMRYGSLGITDIYCGVSRKIDVLKGWMHRCGLDPGQVAYVGDDVPDYEPMKHVGLSVAPADAANDVKAVALYVSRFRGGEGVARDLLEQILRAQDLWMNDDKAFGW